MIWRINRFHLKQLWLHYFRNYSFPVIVSILKSWDTKEKRLASLTKETLVPIAMGSHLFPFRTESLSPSALMVLELMLRESKSVPTQLNIKPLLIRQWGLSCFIPPTMGVPFRFSLPEFLYSLSTFWDVHCESDLHLVVCSLLILQENKVGWCTVNVLTHICLILVCAGWNWNEDLRNLCLA